MAASVTAGILCVACGADMPLGWEQAAEESGFVLAKPEGPPRTRPASALVDCTILKKHAVNVSAVAVNAGHEVSFNAGTCCGEARRLKLDDEGFVHAAVVRAAKEPVHSLEVALHK